MYGWSMRGMTMGMWIRFRPRNWPGYFIGGISNYARLMSERGFRLLSNLKSLCGSQMDKSASKVNNQNGISSPPLTSKKRSY